jgi:hypothetical protein
MSLRSLIGALALLAGLNIVVCEALAFDESKYPPWRGQWRRIGGIQWDPSRKLGLDEQPPLKPQYQALFEASLADQATGGQGNDPTFTCIPPGMPRAMTVVFPMEIIIMPDTTYMIIEYDNQVRIYLDKTNNDLLHDEVTTIDNALTQPWTVLKTYRRERDPIWFDYNCPEGNHHVRIGKENYYISEDGALWPSKKGQTPPQLKYFDQKK